MILTCPECTTSYEAPIELLGPDGRKVKCHKCGHIWLAASDAPEDLSVADENVDAPGNTGTDDGDDGADFDDLIVRDSKPEDEPSAEIGTDGDAPDKGASDIDSENEASDFDEPAEPEDQLGDAEPEPDGSEEGPPSDDADVGDVETIATIERERDQVSREGAGSSFARVRRYGAIAASLIILLGGLLVFRDTVVRFAPGSARLFALAGFEVNLRGLEFRDIVYAREFEDGIPVLAVRGEIVNVTEEPVLLPQIRFSLRDSGAQEVYYWTGSVDPDLLAPADVVPFESRLASPPPGAQEILVRFAGR